MEWGWFYMFSFKTLQAVGNQAASDFWFQDTKKALISSKAEQMHKANGLLCLGIRLNLQTGVK